MNEKVMNAELLGDYIITTFHTKQVRVREGDSGFFVEPIEELEDCTIGLRGILADYPEMSVDKFLARKHADRDLDLQEVFIRQSLVKSPILGIDLCANGKH